MINRAYSDECNLGAGVSNTSIATQSYEGHVKPLLADASTRLYKKRFWMLFIFSLCNTAAGIQVPMYSAITNVIECYHNVSPFAVNLTSLIFPIAYIVLVLPVSWFISRFDVKVALVCGSLLNCLSAVIQYFSVNQDGFPLVMVSQAVAALAHLFIMPLAPRISALWFGATDQGRSISISALANQVGYSIGFLLPTSIVSNDCSNTQLIKEGRTTIAYFMTGYTFIVVLLVISTVGGVALAFGVLINQIFEPLYEGSEKIIGWLGVGVNILGSAAGFLAGYLLDVTQKFHEISLGICLLNLISMVSIMGFLFIHQLWVQFVTILLNGIFLVSYTPVGFNFGAEIAYPEPEATITGLLIMSNMIFSIVLTMVGSYLLVSYGLPEMCLFFGNVLILSCVTAALTTPRLKRCEVNFKKQTTSKIKSYDMTVIRSSKL